MDSYDKRKELFDSACEVFNPELKSEREEQVNNVAQTLEKMFKEAFILQTNNHKNKETGK